MVKDVQRFFLYLGIAGLILVSNPLFAQLKLGDNLGSHKATKDLDMQSHNISAANLIAAKGAVIGTATALSNASVALQVEGTDKAILVPRVTDLLNATTPSIPVANALNGMIVYDLATSKFYYRQNNAWVVYADANKYVDRFLPQTVLGKKIFQSDSGFVVKGKGTVGPIPITGSGSRMSWYPGKASFRAGTVGASQWDDANTGAQSAAFGSNNTASGINSSAFGNNNIASGDNSVAFGSGGNAATANGSAVFGSSNTASGVSSISAGVASTASGLASMAVGSDCTSTGLQSMALGFQAHATNTVAMAFGSTVTADALYSTAFGANLTTNGQNGSMLFGDANGAGSTGTVSNSMAASAFNQMSMRFSGGYRLFSSVDVTSVDITFGVSPGAYLNSGQSAWSTISDKRKKTNFETADAESFLVKIDTMQLGSWNYKGQDVKTFRHYGPMAQDFYGAFGKDSYGAIGCDTLINSADFDGVNMIAIKGLIKRTNSLVKENDELKRMVSELRSDTKVAIAALMIENKALMRKLLKQESKNVKPRDEGFIIN